ncbi:hypothetical protein NX801_07760 [Streptomyces sp. LP05-1]|uniref:Uncharacterized protein n=1 Tax=Streptomyces pyxinae TaxID=2970734 RepID=A0ABT2CDV9_9ACTN|nr:hypothetical protein [Streptomyces sp. LP05-1]MCS0635556.1 hypothetical protein [Streptomyces sp. LP05-1]
MARKKPDPCPDTVWHVRGACTAVRPAQTIEKWLARQTEKGEVETFTRVPPPDPDSDRVVFEALWFPEARVHVRARLLLLTGDRGEEMPAHRPHSWQLIAEATRPWDWSWPSPATMFWPETIDVGWDQVAARPWWRYRLCNPVPSIDEARLTLRLAVQAESDIHVFTTVSEEGVRGLRQGEEPEPPLMRYRAASLLGRVVEHRIAPHVLDVVNQQLPTPIEPGDALIIPSRAHRAGLRPADLRIRGALNRPGRPPELMAALHRYAELPRPAGTAARAGIALLRESFTLDPENTPEGRLAAAVGQYVEARVELRDVRTELADARREARDHEERARCAEAEARAARDELDRLRAAHDELRAVHEAGDLGRALRERERAEQEAEAAEELLDELTREVGWLRVQLAEADRPAPAVPEPRTAPDTWEELVLRTGTDLPGVVLGDVLATSRALRGHALEATWRRRAWEALQALDAYARAKAEHGADKIPHLTAYLQWRGAPVPLPRSRYASGESRTVLTAPKLRDARMLPVPREVHPAGRVLMAEHIRIGSGTPPAPRLHLYDNTAGDGRIYVGHIGEHLPNTKTS